MDKLSPEQRRKNMQAVKAKGSVIEMTLAKALWQKGYRYRKNDKSVFGKPDFTFKKLKIAIFVDSEFWHGKNWRKSKHHHKSNQEFWHRKIEQNIKRDKTVNKTLKNNDWTVIRFWGNEIQKNVASCVIKIEESIKTKKAECHI
ncbi:MAG: very short patch repair endonuclease [Bacteroidetes bacterium]|nr:very short patch repair endonuclease [Bacteroidota bacterium]